MVEFIGRLHPVLVHLPIGIFIIALVMDLVSRSARFSYLEPSLRFMYSIGLLGSVLSLVSGYYLSQEGNNPAESMELHKWVAIATTALFAVYFFLRTKIVNSTLLHNSTLFILFAAMTTTGHLGGSLTHGDDFLWQSKALTAETKTTVSIANLQEAVLYKDFVQHTLNMKCVQCHGEKIQKGKLRLDNIDWIERGGKHGGVLNESDAMNSELIKRMLLDMNDEYHMPPKKKPQLTEFEIEIIQWWANAGAPYDKKIADLLPDEKVQKSLNQFIQLYASTNKIEKKERPKIAALEYADKKELERSGWVVTPVSQEDQHLRVTGFNLEIPVTAALQQLAKSRAAVIELKLSGTKLKDSDLSSLASFPLLEKLWLDHNTLSSVSIQHIKMLSKLGYINLTKTALDSTGIYELLAMPSLHTVYLTANDLSHEQILSIKNRFKKVRIDFGKDTMQVLPTDTLFVVKTNTTN